MVKRMFCAALALLIVLCVCLPLASCQKEKNDGKISIVCTIFPQYSWLKNIIRESDDIELTLLINNGSDMHSYEPSAADIMKIAECDMIVYLGDGIDGWVGEAIELSGCENIKKIALAEIDGVERHDISASSHSHDGHGHDDHDHDDHGTLDEHLWLSLFNATLLTNTLCDAICELDPENEENYRRNAGIYVTEIAFLRLDFEAAVAKAGEQDRFMLFCDRFPFVYLLEELGVEYYAAFEGCSADADADFGTVLRLIEEAEEHAVKYVVVTESSDGELANTVANSVNGGQVSVLTMNSMQAVSNKEIVDGASYLSIMKDNLRVLEIALGVAE